MTRADYIRKLKAAGTRDMDHEELADRVKGAGFERPSRQAIESALAKSGERGRPTERAKCPTCGQRVSGPIDMQAPFDYAQGKCAEGEYVWVHGGDHKARKVLAPTDAHVMRPVANTSQAPRTKRAPRTTKSRKAK